MCYVGLYFSSGLNILSGLKALDYVEGQIRSVELVWKDDFTREQLQDIFLENLARYLKACLYN